MSSTIAPSAPPGRRGTRRGCRAAEQALLEQRQQRVGAAPASAGRRPRGGRARARRRACSRVPASRGSAAPRAGAGTGRPGAVSAAPGRERGLQRRRSGAPSAPRYTGREAGTTPAGSAEVPLPCATSRSRPSSAPQSASAAPRAGAIGGRRRRRGRARLATLAVPVGCPAEGRSYGAPATRRAGAQSARRARSRAGCSGRLQRSGRRAGRRRPRAGCAERRAGDFGRAEAPWAVWWEKMCRKGCIVGGSGLCSRAASRGGGAPPTPPPRLGIQAWESPQWSPSAAPSTTRSTRRTASRSRPATAPRSPTGSCWRCPST